MARINDQFSDVQGRQKRYRLRQKAAGNCIVCGKAAVTKNHCEEHRTKVNGANSERERDKRAQNPKPRKRRSRHPEVFHEMWGRGIVVAVRGDVATVDFSGERRNILAQFLRPV